MRFGEYQSTFKYRLLPRLNLNLDVSKKEFSTVYNMYTYSNIYSFNIIPHDYWISKSDFRDKYPLFVIGVSYKHENIKDIAINTRAIFTFISKVLKNTAVDSILVSESYFSYSSGINMIKIENYILYIKYYQKALL